MWYSENMKYLLFMVLLCGCNPNSLEDFQHEGEALCRSIVADLQDINNREDLVNASPKLKKRFNNLVDLMIEARTYSQEHPEECALPPSTSSEQLLSELKRVYALDGGKEIVERAQREALIRLDAFERSLAKEQLTRK